MTEIVDVLDRASALLRDVARLDRSTLVDDDLVALMAAEEATGRLIDVSRALTAGEVDARSRFDLGSEGLSFKHGHRKPLHFIEQVTKASQSEALRRMRVGHAIRNRVSMLGAPMGPERPLVAEAMIAGTLGIDSAASIVRGLKQAEHGSDASPERLDTAEFELVKLATTASADLVADAGRAWRDALDPDGVEPRFEHIRGKRLFTRGRERNGITWWRLGTEPLLTAQLDAVLLEPMGDNAVPRFMSDEDRASSIETVQKDGEQVEVVVDRRSFEERQYDALLGVVTAGLAATREGPAAFRTIGSVSAVIQLKDLIDVETNGPAGFGIIEGVDETIPASYIRELACTFGIRKIVIGPRNEPLFHGVLEGFFTAAQRRAMVARDGDRCIARGCRRRAASCHGHHVVFWSEGGQTDITNGVLLCEMHHHALHQRAFEIRMIDGIPWTRTRAEFLDDDAWRPAGKNRLLMGLAA